MGENWPVAILNVRERESGKEAGKGERERKRERGGGERERELNIKLSRKSREKL